MAGTKELVERLNGENPDKVVATDRLRMFAYDPDTFEFDQHDALSLIPTIEEAADALERLERERDEATRLFHARDEQLTAEFSVSSKMARLAEAAEAELSALRARLAKMEEALTTLVYEVTHLSPEDDRGRHSCYISKDALESARAALRSLTGAKP